VGLIEIRRYPLSEVFCLSYIENFPILVVKLVNPWIFRKGAHLYFWRYFGHGAIRGLQAKIKTNFI
jgi:hypothetical protein